MSAENEDENKVLLKLRDIRRSKGMSLNTLADKVGVDYQRVGRIERGETQMTIDMLSRIAKALKVPVSQLIGDNDLAQLQENIAEQNNKPSSVYLIPTIYEKLEAFCKEHNIDVDNSAKVHVATVMFQTVQDIRTSVKDDEEMVKALFQAFHAIFERLVLQVNNQDDGK